MTKLPKKKAKTKDAPSKHVDVQPTDKAVKLFPLALTRYELIHLRDLFGVSLPSPGATVSQSLAALEKRTFVEENLWKKVHSACQEAKVQLSEKAPDYVIATVGQPQLNVFQLATDPDEASSPDEEREEPQANAELLLSGRREV